MSDKFVMPESMIPESCYWPCVRWDDIKLPQLDEHWIRKGQVIGRHGHYDLALLFAGTMKRPTDREPIEVVILEFFEVALPEYKYERDSAALTHSDEETRNSGLHQTVYGCVDSQRWLVTERLQYSLADALGEVKTARRP